MIYIENLDFGYQKKREVFSGLNLSLTGGHIYGLLGKNGAGKTTLLKLIGGLLFPLRCYSPVEETFFFIRYFFHS